VEDLLNGNSRNFTIPNIPRYNKITLQMFRRWGLLVAGVAGALAGVMAGVMVSGSNDNKPERITLYNSREFIYESKAGNTTLLMTTGRTFLTISLTRPLSSGAGAVEKSSDWDSIL